MDAPRLSCDGRLLIVQLGGPHRLLSFAILGGGFVSAESVVWCGVRDDELRPPVDPRALPRRSRRRGGARRSGRPDDQRAARRSRRRDARAGWRRRAQRRHGRPRQRAPGGRPRPRPAARHAGHHQRPLRGVDPGARRGPGRDALDRRRGAHARRLEGGVASRRSGRAATGTGTDCIVVAAPCGSPQAGYAGKHTVLGHLVGASVGEAVARGVAAWLAQHPARRRDRRRRVSRGTIVLIGGGARSGKSTFALERARTLGARRVFLATAQAFDGEMEQRIAPAPHDARRRLSRPSRSRSRCRACSRALADADVVVVDCLTLWLSNLLLRGDAPACDPGAGRRAVRRARRARAARGAGDQRGRHGHRPRARARAHLSRRRRYRAPAARAASPTRSTWRSSASCCG